ncbi:MAG: hypothetical protein IKM69_07075 [Alistipes sp.]|nr:hypothetical protein [Alistipes sp.]
MRQLLKISVFVMLLGAVSCRELPDYLMGDDVIARVGGELLTVQDISAVVPSNLKGDDSLSFVKQYTDKWLVRQLKVNEADELFSGTEKDIEKLVEDYRQTLLTSKVDQYYIDQQMSDDVSQEDITEYYNTHKSQFLLDRTLVKGRILRFDATYRQSTKLKTQMQKAATSQNDDKAFSDLCAKNNFLLIDNRSEWVNFADFLSNLPIPQSQNNEPLLDKMGVQELKIGSDRYYFDFTSVCRKGNVAPLEIVSDNIRRILITQRRSQIIKSHEEQILKSALEDGDAKVYKNMTGIMDNEQTNKK